MMHMLPSMFWHGWKSTAQATVDASSAVGIFDSINMGLNDEEEVVYNIKYVTVNGAKEVK